MDAHWKRSIDQTLRNTRSTLKRLQERHATYADAKRRVDEALGNSPSSADLFDREQGESSALRRASPAGAVPPPLPPASALSRSRGFGQAGMFGTVFEQHSSNGQRRTADPAAGSYARHAQDSAEEVDRTASLVWGADPSAPSSVKELADAVRVLRAQLRSVTVELELERTVRADGHRELTHLHRRQVEELASAVQRLDSENAFLKKSLHALEAQRAFGVDGGKAAGVSRISAGAPSPSMSAFGDASYASTAGRAPPQAPLDHAKSSFLGYSTAGTAAAAGSGDGVGGEAPLRQTVWELESRVRQHQRLLEDRDYRVHSVLKDMVDAKVNAEVERMRSVAREAARESTESLVQLRLNGLQSTFHDELHRVMEATGMAQEVSQATDRVLRQWEREWGTKWSATQDALTGMQRDLVTAKATAEALSHVERRLNDGLDAARAAQDAAQRELHEKLLRLSQTTAANVEATRVETLAAAARAMEDHQQRLQKEGMLLRVSDAQRMVDAAVLPMESRLESLDAVLKRTRETADEWQRQASRRLGALETDVACARADVEKLQMSTQTQTAAVESAALQLTTCCSTAQSASSVAASASAAASEAVATVAALQERYGDESARAVAQAKRLSLSHDSLKEAVQRLTAARDATEERLSEVTVAVAALEGAVPRAVQPLTVKLDSLQQILHETCLPSLDALQESVTGTAGRVQQLQDSRASQERQSTQQVASLHKDVDARARELESRMRRDLDEVQMRAEAQTDGLGKKLSALSKTVTALSTNSIDRVDDLGSRVTKLEVDAASTLEVLRSTRATQPHGTTEPELAKAASDSPVTVSAMAPFPAPDDTALVEAEERWHRRLDDTVEQQDRLLRQTIDSLKEETQAAVARAVQLTQQRVADLGAQVKRMDAATKEQAETFYARLAEGEEQASAMMVSSAARMKELTAPLRLVNAVITDDGCLSQLASNLHGRLTSSADTLAAISELHTVQRRVEQRLGELSARVDSAAERAAADAERQEEVARAVAASPAVLSPSVPSDTTGPAAEALMARLLAVEEDTHSGLELLSRRVQDAQSAARECRTMVDAALPPLQRRVAAAESRASEMSIALDGTHDRIQQQVSAFAEAQRAEHEAALQPLVSRLTRVQEDWAAVRSEQEQSRSSVASATNTQQRVDELHGVVAGLRTQLETQQQLLLSDFIHPLQDTVARLSDDSAAKAELMHATAAVQATPDAGGVDDSAVASIQTQLDSTTARVQTLEAAWEKMEGTEDEGLLATADALAGLRDSLRLCVDRAAEYMRTDRWALSVASGAGADEDGAPTLQSDGPPLKALDDLILLLLTQVSGIHNALSTLQQNAVATLELIQQQELDVLVIPTLQEAVLTLSARLRPVAEAAGVDPALFVVDVGPPVASGETEVA